MPMQRHLYPADRLQIVARVRSRSGDRCEFCDGLRAIAGAIEGGVSFSLRPTSTTSRQAAGWRTSPTSVSGAICVMTFSIT
jgi:hypothetical protein